MSDSTNVSIGNNIFVLQRDVAVSDVSPPPPSPARRHTHRHTHTDTHTQTAAFIISLLSNSRNSGAPWICFPPNAPLKYCFYSTPGADVVLKQTELNLREVSVYAGSHFIKPVKTPVSKPTDSKRGTTKGVCSNAVCRGG